MVETRLGQSAIELKLQANNCSIHTQSTQTCKMSITPSSGPTFHHMVHLVKAQKFLIGYAASCGQVDMMCLVGIESQDEEDSRQLTGNERVIVHVCVCVVCARVTTFFHVCINRGTVTLRFHD